MKIAIEGCAHGELNKIYDSIKYIEECEHIKIDLLICCGDFQSVRDHVDMISMAVPPKYREMKDFADYYTGKRKAPVLTLFIGGNHEAATYLWELPYGGWVAENIFYLGYANVVTFAGLRIGGISGIYKARDYYKGHFECPPFNEDTKRSFYHVRSIDVAKLKLLDQKAIDIFLSHDWPRHIYNFGDTEQLLRFKPFLKDEVKSNSLGSDAAEDLLKTLKPTYWFSGHMHAKFSAIVEHNSGTITKFLALDKCLPKRNFLQIIDVGSATEEAVLKYDSYWLSILKSTNEIFSDSCKQTFLTELSDDYKPNQSSIDEIENLDLNVIKFSASVKGLNPQTNLFCERFQLSNPCVNNKTAAIVNNQYGSSRQSFAKQRKINIPKPKHSDVSNTSGSEEFRDIEVKSRPSTTEYEFSELTNPSMSSNPDEISLSDDSSDSDSEEKQLSNMKRNTFPETTPAKPIVEQPSFIETPLKVKEITSSEGTDLSSNNEEGSDVSPMKKFKLVRRNQCIYTPNKDEEE